MQDVFINTLVFKESENFPINQCNLIRKLVKEGFRNIEIRREYISDFEKELQEISDVVRENSVNLYYSIADSLFDDDKINQEKINEYYREAEIMNSKSIKLSVGNYTKISNNDEVFLKSLLSNDSIFIFVENDQTISNGKVEKIINFLNECKSKNISMKATFDIGNWLWTGENPKENAEILKEYVEYVHFKDVTIQKGRLTTVILGDGQVDYEYFCKFFKGKTFALEYPCGDEPISVIKDEIKKLGD